MRFKKEGTYVHLWAIHVDVWQKPTQYCKTIILQLKINTLKKKKEDKEKPTQNEIGVREGKITRHTSLSHQLPLWTTGNKSC